MMILGSRGIPSWLAAIGIEDLRIINTPSAVLIGAVYGFLPLMVPPIYVSLEKLDRRLLEAAADLGATPLSRFMQVTLPMSLPGVATGSMLVFILLMGDYILPQFLGGGKVFFIGNALVDLFLQSRNWPFGAAVSVALVAIMFATIVVYMRFVLGLSGQRRVALV
jgi:spermidine/putrescine transport system permease protein